MLQVALSRRMCCSRVCSAMRSGGLAAGVDRDADDPAGHGALVGVPGGEEGGVRAAIAHRHAEALGGAEDDVGTQLAGRGEQRQGQQVGGDAGEAAGGMDGVDDGPRVADRTVAAGILDQDAEQVLARGLGPGVAGDQLDAEMARTGAQDGQRLRVAVGVGEEAVGLVAPDAMGHGHGLGGGGGLVEQRGVGQLHGR